MKRNLGWNTFGRTEEGAREDLEKLESKDKESNWTKFKNMFKN